MTPLVRYGFYAELERLREAVCRQSGQFSTHFCRQIDHLMQGCFIFSVDNSFIVRRSAVLPNTALIRSQARSLPGPKHVSEGRWKVITICFSLVLCSARLE